jgi:uncharacterized protein (TIGR04255 family)
MDYKFRKPPIQELICGVQYKNINLSLPIINEFYTGIKEEFPKIEEKQALGFIAYSMKDADEKILQLKNDAIVRYWFLKKDDTQLIQLQKNRYHYNWRRLGNENETYPHFKNVFDEFKTNFEKFKNHVNNYKQNIEINYLEITFLDHIKVSDFGDKLKVDEIFTFLKNDNILAKADGFQITYRVPIEICDGNYQLTAYTAIKEGSKDLIIILNTTLNGKLNDKSNNYETWFKNAHDIIKNEFYNQITGKAKKIWGEEK